MRMSILLTGQVCKYHSAYGAMGSNISIKFPEGLESDQSLLLQSNTPSKSHEEWKGYRDGGFLLEIIRRPHVGGEWGGKWMNFRTATIMVEDRPTSQPEREKTIAELHMERALQMC